MCLTSPRSPLPASPHRAHDPGGFTPSGETVASSTVLQSATGLEAVSGPGGAELIPRPRRLAPGRSLLHELPAEIVQGPVNRFLSLAAQATLLKTSKSTRMILGNLPQHRDEFKAAVERLVPDLDPQSRGGLDDEARAKVQQALDNRVLPARQKAEIAGKVLDQCLTAGIQALRVHSAGLARLGPHVERMTERIRAWPAPARDLALHALARNLTHDLAGGTWWNLYHWYDTLLSCDPALQGRRSDRARHLAHAMRAVGDPPAAGRLAAWAGFLASSVRREPIFHGIELQHAAWQLRIAPPELRVRMFDDILHASRSGAHPREQGEQVRAVLRDMARWLPSKDLPSRLARVMAVRPGGRACLPSSDLGVVTAHRSVVTPVADPST